MNFVVADVEDFEGVEVHDAQSLNFVVAQVYLLDHVQILAVLEIADVLDLVEGQVKF